MMVTSPPALMVERSGPAMGSRFHLVVTGRDDLDPIADQLIARLTQLEARWSRFRPTSEVSQLNSQPHRGHLVSADTARLVATACRAWLLTGGAYDPTVLASVHSHGYQGSLITSSGAEPHPMKTEPVSPAPGCAGIEVDLASRLVRLGSGVGFDPGGIGKGLAADLVAEAALELGATGVLVGLGGDIVCRGAPPDGHSWPIDVSEPTVTRHPIAHLQVAAGAVVTSTTRKRHWLTDAGRRHHLVDPRTGLNTDGPVLATVVAAEGWWAEAVATQLMVDGPGATIDWGRAAAVVIDPDGVRHTVGPIEDYQR